jgi:NitT/TauT family transport system substrate-binding protein
MRPFPFHRGFASLVVLASLLWGSPVHAEPEQRDVAIAVGGQGLYYYLPLAIAQQRGYFRDAGLDVEIADFPGGSKSLQAVVGGSADVAAGAFEHVLNMQAKGQDLRAIVLLARYPGMVLGLPPARAAGFRSAADLNGLKVGVTAPGSSTHMFLNHLLGQAGLAADAVSVIGIGAGASAVAAMRRGDIDAMVHLDPVIQRLEADGVVQAVVDTRTAAGATAVYGGPYHAACLYARADFIAAHPQTTQAIVDAQVRALRWLQTATPDEIVASVPPAFLGGDAAAYRRALLKNLSILSLDGRLDLDGAVRVLEALRGFEAFVRKADVDPARALTNDFVERALAVGE